MRKLIDNQFEDKETPFFGVLPIDQVRFDIRSRDEVTKILLGLQDLYNNEHIRKSIFSVLEEMIPSKTSLNRGRTGMPLWTIFVLGTLRLSCN